MVWGIVEDDDDFLAIKAFQLDQQVLEPLLKGSRIKIWKWIGLLINNLLYSDKLKQQIWKGLFIFRDLYLHGNPQTPPSFCHLFVWGYVSKHLWNLELSLKENHFIIHYLIVYYIERIWYWYIFFIQKSKFFVKSAQKQCFYLLQGISRQINAKTVFRHCIEWIFHQTVKKCQIALVSQNFSLVIGWYWNKVFRYLVLISP